MSQHTPFDVPFGFRIKHIEEITDIHGTSLKFTGNQWKPPVRTENIRITYDPAPETLSHGPHVVWRPPRADHSGNTENRVPVTVVQSDERQHYIHYKTASMFWATDTHTFLHVPVDCTRQNVEEPEADDSDESDTDTQDERDYGSGNTEVHRRDDRTQDDDVIIGEQLADPEGQPYVSDQPVPTWRRLRFHHHHPNDHPATISYACYTGGCNELGGRLPDRWRSTLMPPVHMPQPGSNHLHDCQLAGDLPLILGLVAFNHAENDRAIPAIEHWFPPSIGITEWRGEGTNHLDEMQKTDQRTHRGMVIETFYDIHVPHAKERLQRWELGLNGPMIT